MSISLHLNPYGISAKTASERDYDRIPHQRFFDPIVTLWAFLSQILDTDKSWN
ncbi:IS4 transposase [Nostoc flagelliforme CCNUN1]|uniref:IS4 transposase n=1 Tax=Nostoc flagelliforme CCNUN1 TaxID=2038116 RepID=A0A2K8T250_9NOSO|nr:hypothetical protein [Nostoc flagelliforme]AUB41693.1 IS4 transposase [Nostoc flagelliforme CCNUN1]